MTPFEILAVFGAGVAAGTINTMVGSGSLITFPILLLFGYPPLVANVSNAIGLVPGSISGSIGYRRELQGQRRRIIPLGIAATLGGLTGGVLLLALPANAFERIVPVLILGACVLVALQPWLSRVVVSRRLAAGTADHELGRGIVAAVFLVGIYGGYFGAAQGVMLMALLSIFVRDDLQRLNALKNVLSSAVNSVAAVLFILIAPVAWLPAILLAIGSILGGQLGASVGRRFSPSALRLLIVVVGSLVAVRLVMT
jgi:uncharacterized membrane protein YfcA